MKTKTLGVYCHIPFCVKKCAYCDFYSGSFYPLADAYIDAILTEARLLKEKYPDAAVDTVYFGGGTPSSLTKEQLETLLTGIISVFSPISNAEITLEANPATLDEEKLSVLKQCGVNRISIGVQSADDNELEALTRLHTFEEFVRTYRLVKRYLSNVSLDLMYGLPNQTLDSFKKTLDEIISLDPEHISLYALKIEENTPFGKIRELLTLPDDDAVSDMYLYACEKLENIGFHQYEISNFAKQDSYSRHNLRYWEGKEYIGLGPSAHAYLDGIRYANAPDIHAYITKLTSNELPPRSEEYPLNEGDLLEEAIILPLRLTKGLDLKKLKDNHGLDLRPKLTPFIQGGFMLLNGDIVSFTPQGFLVSNTILSELIP